MAETKEKSMIIDGIAAAQTVDSSGEILQIKGCDISSLKEGKGVLNWEHQGPPLGEKDKDKRDTPKNAIGKIIYAKKIFDLEDCEDARQKFFFNKINKIPYIYIKARLFDAAGHEDAKAAAASFRDAVMHKEAPLINFSIEGHTIEKEGNKIMVSFARAVAATHKPCNKAAIATVLHDPVTGEKHEIEGKKDDTLAGLAEVEKHEIPGRQVLSSVPIDYDPIVNEDPYHLLKCAVENLQKTLTAGMGGGAPGTLTQGAALQREDLRKKVVTTFLKNQFLGALRDFDPYEHKDFKKFLKSRLPEVDDSFIDYFDAMAQEFKMRKAEEQVRRLEFLTIELKKNAIGAVAPQPPALSHNGKAPIHLNAAEHGHEYNTHPEQHEMIHGLHFNQQDSGQLGQMGVSDSRKVKLPSGKHAILKREIGNGAGITDLPSTAHAEILYHNAAKHFFGLGQFVPTTAGIKTPNDNPDMPPEMAGPINHSVMEAIPNARHLHDSKAPDGRDAISQQNHNIILQHGQNGDLDKLAIMNSVLGNRDRHSGNFMFSDNQMHLIDHGHSFAFGGRPGYAPADPGYLSHYHEAVTGHPWRDGWFGVKIHPEAAKWAMSLKPQNLVKFMKGHGVDSALAMHAGHRLASVQRLIQQKGLDTGIWEAYNTPWGRENPTLHQELQTHAMKEQANAQRMASPAGATRV